MNRALASRLLREFTSPLTIAISPVGLVSPRLAATLPALRDREDTISLSISLAAPPRKGCAPEAMRIIPSVLPATTFSRLATRFCCANTFRVGRVL